MKAIAVSEFNFALYSQAELDRIYLRSQLEQLAKMMATWHFQEAKTTEPRVSVLEEVTASAIVPATRLPITF